mgnify:CR=1 FL=1
MTGRHIENIFKFGASACFNQIAMTIVQIVLNNTLSHYGAQSVYGGDIPLACAGIITKVNMIFMSFVIGISQGIQPIIGFNYGAEKYERVRKSYLLALGTATVLSGIAFFCFQVFPRQIISVFGSGSELYFQFSERYFRIYMFLTLINGIQPVTSNFFNSIGKSQLGVFMSLTRQILFSSESESSVPVTPNDSSDDSEMALKISANKNADTVIGGLEATLMYAKITPEMKLSNDKTAVIINAENLDQNTKDIILRTARITRNFDM